MSAKRKNSDRISNRDEAPEITDAWIEEADLRRRGPELITRQAAIGESETTAVFAASTRCHRVMEGHRSRLADTNGGLARALHAQAAQAGWIAGRR